VAGSQRRRPKRASELSSVLDLYLKYGTWRDPLPSRSAFVNWQRLESALKIDKNYGDAESALKWAKDGLKAAKKGKQPKAPSPKRN